MGDNDPTLTQAAEPETTPERAGKYRIAGRIGQGGMGIVYRGTDEDLGRTVALKFLPPELAGNSEAAHRFLREARAASALDHPNIGTIFGVEETADHRRFIVMAFYEGRNLHERMKDTLHPIGPAEALSIAVQVARGLAAAHAHEVVHRDIKPSNILITSQGVVKIVDFGLAAMVDAEQLTEAGTRMGTPAYMSPEQALGKTVDRRSDIWSLGVVLLEMLTHERVFRAEAMQGVLYQVVHGEIAGLGRLQQPLRGVVARALDRDPEKRWQSANDFLEALEGLSGTLPELKAARVPRRIFRLAGVLPVVAIFLAVLLGGGVYYGKFRGPGKVAVAPRSSSIFDKYRQAVDLMTRWDKEGNLERAAALLAENVKADPTFALGFARLAETQRLRYALTRDQKALDEANEHLDASWRGERQPDRYKAWVQDRKPEDEQYDSLLRRVAAMQAVLDASADSAARPRHAARRSRRRPDGRPYVTVHVLSSTARKSADGREYHIALTPGQSLAAEIERLVPVSQWSALTSTTPLNVAMIPNLNWKRTVPGDGHTLIDAWRDRVLALEEWPWHDAAKAHNLSYVVEEWASAPLRCHLLLYVADARGP